MKRLKTFAGFAFVFSAVVFAGIGYASLSDSFNRGKHFSKT